MGSLWIPAALLQVTLADQVALVVENDRLEAETTRQQYEAGELALVASLIGERLDPLSAGQRIAEGVLGLLGVHSAVIRLFQPDGALGAIALAGRAKETRRSGTASPPGSVVDAPRSKGDRSGPATSASTAASSRARPCAPGTWRSESWPASRSPCTRRGW